MDVLFVSVLVMENWFELLFEYFFNGSVTFLGNYYVT